MKIVERPIGEDDLQSYVDGRLDTDQRDAVEQYMREQPEVAMRVAAYAQQRDDLRLALHDRYDAPIPAHLRVDYISGQVASRRRQRFSTLAAAVAALVIGGAGGWTARTALDTPAAQAPQMAAAEPPMIDALVVHRVYVADVKHPIEVGADQKAHLQMWLSKRVGLPLVAPDLSASGYRLMGGRLLAASTGPAALFMYDNAQKERLTIYVRSSPHRNAAPVRVIDDAGLRAAYWYDGGFGFAVSAETARGSILEAARSARAQITT